MMDGTQGFSAFVWSDQYATGIAEVDLQHRQLVLLINQIGGICALESDIQKAKPILDELGRYTQYHFLCEENLMGEFGLEAAHIASHCKAHEYFRQQVENGAGIVTHNPGTSMQLLTHLLGYLTNWLVHHILGMDMRMAREIQALQAGENHADAASHAAAAIGKSSDVLLDALNAMYAKLGEKTLEVMSKNQQLERQQKTLLVLNEKLEQRVSQRTAELENANRQLLASNHELTLLNEKIEAAHTQLLQAEKMASIGQLAAGVAHEINNPIGFVNSNLGTLGKYVSGLCKVIDTYEQSEGKEWEQASMAVAEVKRSVDLPYLREDIPILLKESQDGLERVKRIISDLRDFSHVDESIWQLASLEHGMDSTLNVVWNELKFKAEIVKEYAGLPEVECLPSQINQVFLNLLMNAIQAIENKGIITIRTGAQDAWVWVEIADTGKGISAKQLNRIFEPFFTTKPVGKGTGLGLSVSYGIVQNHGGRFEVNSTEGKGTTMRLWLPKRHSTIKGYLHSEVGNNNSR
jgi:hemerythrin-like metal-binding protein